MATKREESAERQRQMRALDQLPQSLRQLIYYAPVNYNPCRILEAVHMWGEKIVLRNKTNEVRGILTELNRQKFDGMC